jgi:hypothetical protein
MRAYELPCICRDALSRPFPLSGARVARMRVEHEARRGAVAEGVVLLPLESAGYILGTLRFENRLKAAGESLYGTWGYPVCDHRRLAGEFGIPHSYRYRSATFAAPTWAEAMKRAWDWAIGEVLRLEEALRVRQEALEAAECKTCTPHEDYHVERPRGKAYEPPCICRDALSWPFSLSGARAARLRMGQQPPCEGDSVVARGVVLLPCEAGRLRIRPSLRAEYLEAAGESLRPEWGLKGGRITNGFGLLDPYRWRFHDFTAPTWAEAMGRAWDWAIGEVLKLEEALRVRRKARRQAPEAAECKTCTPCEDPYVERPEEEALRRLENLGGPEDRP